MFEVMFSYPTILYEVTHSQLNTSVMQDIGRSRRMTLNNDFHILSFSNVSIFSIIKRYNKFIMIR